MQSQMLKVSGALAACLSTVAIGLCLVGVPMVYMEIQAARRMLDADMLEFRVRWLFCIHFRLLLMVCLSELLHALLCVSAAGITASTSTRHNRTYVCALCGMGSQNR